MATPSPIASITFARRAANSSAGKTSGPRNTGCAESSTVRLATRATLNNARCMKHPLDSAPLRARLFLRACRGWRLHDRYGHARGVLLRVMDHVVRHDSGGLIVIVAAGVQVAIEPREIAARHLDAQPVPRGEVVARRERLQRDLVYPARFHPR